MRHKNIIPNNKEGNRHGYCEVYLSCGIIYYRGYYVNGKVVGYREDYSILIREISIFI